MLDVRPAITRPQIYLAAINPDPPPLKPSESTQLTITHAAELWSVGRQCPADLRAVVKAHVPGSVVIDVGCGDYYKSMQNWCREIGAAGYVALDRYLLGNQRDEGRVEYLTPTFWSMRVRQDGASYLRALPDRCCCITVNALDEFIIPDIDYHVELGREIGRVTKLGGVVFGINSPALGFLDGESVVPGFNEDIRAGRWIDHVPELYRNADPGRQYWQCYERTDQC